MSRARRRAIAILMPLVASLVLTVPDLSAAVSLGTAGQKGTWELLAVPKLPGQASLNSVIALADDDAWAVGTVSESDTVHSLTLHWDGIRWQRVPSPNRTGQNWLVAVDALSATDVWAAGSNVTPGGRHRTMAMRWDGNGWQFVPTPDPGEIGSLLNGVAVRAPDDVWVVGGSIVEFPLRGETMALHWDGATWERAKTPNPSVTGVGSYLHSVDITSGGRVWAAGSVDRGDFVMGTLVVRTVGKRWAMVPTANDPAGSLASALTAPNAGHVWTVGWRQQDDGSFAALAMQRRAGRWATSSLGSADDASLADVAVIDGHTWVFGYDGTGTLAARRTGSAWRVEPTLSPGEVASGFLAGAGIPRTRCLWAVGQFTNGDRGQPLIERYCSPR